MNKNSSFFIIKPNFEEEKANVFTFHAKTHACAHKALLAPIFQELWQNFCCQRSEINFSVCDKPIFQIGKVLLPATPENGFKLIVNESGVGIIASDVQNLVYGFFALLERIKPISVHKGNEKFEIACTYVQDFPILQTRMLHLCVFPETSLFFLKKMMRLGAFLRYTHIIIEFWGTYQYDCFKELAWKNAFTKEQLKPIFEEIKALGVEIVPMFNHWGHASSSRVSLGKHVVLDQNMEYAPYFDVSGWNWNLKNPNVLALHKKIREELIELCGDGEYFHIGCDEAYGALTTEDCLDAISYINRVADELKSKNRKVLMWGDMLLCHQTLNKQTNNTYACFCETPKAQSVLLSALSKNIIIADWQYDATVYPLETSIFFQEHGFQVLSCPWHNLANTRIVAKTAIQHNFIGVMHTTWHTLSTGIGAVVSSAVAAWGNDAWNWDANYGFTRAYLASILRKLANPNGVYENAGWSEKQTQDYL